MKVVILALVFCLPALSFALSCPSSKTPKLIAEDLIKIEFAGLHISGQEMSECLKQENFKHYAIEYDASNEAHLGKTFSLRSTKSLKVKKVELVDPDVYLYRADYSVKTSSNKIVNDSITFFLYKDERNQKTYGCGGVTEAPKNRVLLRRCEVAQ